MVNLFQGTEMTLLFETLGNVRKVLTDLNCMVNGEAARATLELSPQRKPMGKAKAMNIDAPSEAEGDKNKMRLSWEGKIQVSFFAEVGPEGMRAGCEVRRRRSGARG